MIQVLKYELPEEPGAHEVAMRPSSHVLSAGIDPRGKLCAWATADSGYAGQVEERTFFIAYTVHSDVADTLDLSTRFIGTVVNMRTGIVFHVWVK